MPSSDQAALTARVAYIQPQVDPTTRAMKVRLDVVNPGMRLKPNMYVNVDFSIAQPARLTVPSEAVLDTGGRQVVFVLVLATLMLPYQVTALPLYVVFVKVFHWVPSLKPLIIPSFFGDAFSIFLLRQFFRSVPDELADAARVDGASHWQIMTRVIVPLAKPAIAAVALFNFLYAWNDFFAPLLYVGEDSSSWTLAIGLSEFKALHHVQWNLTMAASLMFMIPVIILFFLAQKVFIEGITVTGVKG